MKNKYISNLALTISVILIFANCELQAQTKIGVRSGLNISNLEYYFDEIKVEDQKALEKIETGIFLEHNISSKFTEFCAD